MREWVNPGLATALADIVVKNGVMPEPPQPLPVADPRLATDGLVLRAWEPRRSAGARGGCVDPTVRRFRYSLPDSNKQAHAWLSKLRSDRAAGRHLELARLWLQIEPENVASQRVAERCGFVREGRLRSHFEGRDGEHVDVLIYGLLPGELHEAR